MFRIRVEGLGFCLRLLVPASIRKSISKVLFTLFLNQGLRGCIGCYKGATRPQGFTGLSGSFIRAISVLSGF